VVVGVAAERERDLRDGGGGRGSRRERERDLSASGVGGGKRRKGPS